MEWFQSLTDGQQTVIVWLEFVIALAAVIWLVTTIKLPAFFHEEIACAAIKYDDIGVLALPAPARHHHVMWSRLFIDGRITGTGSVQGFLTTNGRFVDRKQACKIANKRGQIVQKHGCDTELYSEDMWDTPIAAWGYHPEKYEQHQLNA